MTTARGIATLFGQLPAALPAGAVIAHKTGDLGFVTHDAGIVAGPGGAPIVLVVLTWDSAEQDGIDLIKEIARLAYEGIART